MQLCKNNQSFIVSYFIEYNLISRDGEWEYQLAFDVNMKDVTGQNVLYLASLLGNYKMVDVLLKFKVKATRVKVWNSYTLLLME